MYLFCVNGHFTGDPLLRSERVADDGTAHWNTHAFGESGTRHGTAKCIARTSSGSPNLSTATDATESLLDAEWLQSWGRYVYC